MNLEYRKKLRAIYKHFGEKAQREKLEEEKGELKSAFKMMIQQDEVLYYRDQDHFLQEVADCIVVSLQLKEVKELRKFLKENIPYIFEYDDKIYILGVMLYKINRTLSRYKIEWRG